MTVKRIVDTKFWEDSKVIDKYSVEDKYFMLYLLTNPMTTQLGIYRLPSKIISFQTGYTIESVHVLIDRFEKKYNNIIYSRETQEIAILNSLKYSVVKGGKPVSDLLSKELNKVEETKLIEEVYKNMENWWLLSDRKFDKTVKELFEAELLKRKEAKEKLNDNDNDNDNDDSWYDSYSDSLELVAEENPKEFDFDLFWEHYPRKVSKGQAEKTFAKVVTDKETFDLILKDLEKRKGFKQWENEQFIPHASTYLNAKSWLDEYETKEIVEEIGKVW